MEFTKGLFTGNHIDLLQVGKTRQLLVPLKQNTFCDSTGLQDKFYYSGLDRASLSVATPNQPHLQLFSQIMLTWQYMKNQVLHRTARSVGGKVNDITVIPRRLELQPLSRNRTCERPLRSDTKSQTLNGKHT